MNAYRRPLALWFALLSLLCVVTACGGGGGDGGGGSAGTSTPADQALRVVKFLLIDGKVGGFGKATSLLPPKLSDALRSP